MQKITLSIRFFDFLKVKQYTVIFFASIEFFCIFGFFSILQIFVKNYKNVYGLL